MSRPSEIWLFATGEKSEIDNLTHAFSVYVQAEGGTIAARTRHCAREWRWENSHDLARERLETRGSDRSDRG